MSATVTAAGSAPVAQPDDRNALHKITGLLGDAVWLLLVIWLFPAAILALGIPVALLVRVLLELAHRV